MSLQDYIDQIGKTGFILENRIAQTLKAAGWTVICGKYYVDDLQETVREIDVIAYRVAKVEHLDVYTVLVISCKKSDDRAWALLAREVNLKDPNSDWSPFHAWSNDKALAYQLSRPSVGGQYQDDVTALGVRDVLAKPAVDVFAFQELNRKDGKPQNDKSIFASVTSLMKAQAYELGALPGRKKAPSVYQFNLLSVVEGELLRLMFADETITCTAIQSEHYLARYIIKKRETFSRIRFMQASVFRDSLEDYERLHQANATWFERKYSSFYEGVLDDYGRKAVLIDDFRRELSFTISWQLRNEKFVDDDASALSVHWNDKINQVELNLYLEDSEILFLNEDERVQDCVKDALLKVFRYEGPFNFTNEIPF